MRRWFKRYQGSSLILVLLVMAGISVFILGTQRVSLLQYRQSVVSTDTIRANQSALAGIEDALLRFRFNRDAHTEEGMEVRMDLTDGIMADYNSEQEGKYKDWYQVLSADSQTKSYPNSYSYDPSHQYYFMRMNYKVSSLGNYDSPEQSTAELKKDEAVEFSGFEYSSVGTGDVTINYRFYFNNDSCRADTSLVQVQSISSNLQDSFNQRTIKMSDFGHDVFDQSGVVIGKMISGNFTALATNPLTFSVRMRAYGCNVKYAFKTDNGAKFDGLITTVLSKGIYGQASVTKVAEIDRKSGRLIGIFDYNLYSKGNIAP